MSEVTPGPGRQDGLVTIQYVWGVALSLVLLVLLANLMAFQYARGVVRSALDEAVRSGARATAAAEECRTRAHQVLDQLLGGPLGAGLQVDCRVVGDRVVATAHGSLDGWLAVVPDHPVEMRASARRAAP